MERRRFQVQAVVVVIVVVVIIIIVNRWRSTIGGRQGAYLIGSTGLKTETFNWITAFWLFSYFGNTRLHFPPSLPHHPFTEKFSHKPQACFLANMELQAHLNGAVKRRHLNLQKKHNKENNRIPSLSVNKHYNFLDT